MPELKGKNKKGIVNFKAIICNKARVVFNFQKKQKEKKKCATNGNRNRIEILVRMKHWQKTMGAQEKTA